MIPHYASCKLLFINNDKDLQNADDKRTKYFHDAT